MQRLKARGSERAFSHTSGAVRRADEMEMRGVESSSLIEPD